MSPFFDDLEAQLRAAAHAEDTHPESPGSSAIRRAWWRTTLRSLPVAAAVAVALLVGAGALVLIGHSRPDHQAAADGPANPLAGQLPPQVGREVAAIRRATAKVLGSRACAVRAPTHVVYLHTKPDQTLLSTVGVLRRAAVASDRLPQPDLMSSGKIYAGYTRRALTLGGTSYFIQAVRVVPGYLEPSARCFALQRRALRDALPRITPKLRAATQLLQERVMAVDARLIGNRPLDAICFIQVIGNGSSSACGDTPAVVRAGQVIQNDGQTVDGVVPDGVASLRLGFGTGAAVKVTTAVRGNVFAVRLPAAARRRALTEVVWLSASGRPIKTRRIALESAANYCRGHIIGCIALGAAYGSGSSASSSSSSTATTRTSSGPRAGG